MSWHTPAPAQPQLENKVRSPARCPSSSVCPPCGVSQSHVPFPGPAGGRIENRPRTQTVLRQPRPAQPAPAPQAAEAGRRGVSSRPSGQALSPRLALARGPSPGAARSGIWKMTVHQAYGCGVWRVLLLCWRDGCWAAGPACPVAAESEAVCVQGGGVGRVFSATSDREPQSFLPGPGRDQAPGARGVGLALPSPSVWTSVRLLWAPPRTRRVRFSRGSGLEESRGLGPNQGEGNPARPAQPGLGPASPPSEAVVSISQLRCLRLRGVKFFARWKLGPNGSDPEPLLPQAAGHLFPR